MSLFGKAVRSVITKETIWGPAASSPNNESFGLVYGWGGTSYAGIPINHDTALTFSAVYACVRFIAEAMAAMPVDVLQRYPTGRYGRPTPDWMRQPNPEMTWSNFILQLEVSRLLDGNAYFIPVVSLDNRVRELWPVDPRLVDVARDSRTGDLVYAISQKPVASNKIVHIKGLTFPGAVKGLSPVELARQTFGLGLAAEKHGSKLFSNGAAFDIVVQNKNTGKPWGEEGAKRVAQSFLRAHQGTDRAHIPVVMDGDADVKQLSMTAEQAQFLATRQFQVEEVCRWFGLSPVAIGLTEKQTSWGTGVEAQYIAIRQMTLLPEATRLEDAFNPLIRLEAGNPDYYCKWNMSSFARGDMTARGQFYQQMWNVGAFCIDDIRALEDMNPLDGGLGQKHYVPLNYQPVDAPPEEPAQGGQE